MVRKDVVSSIDLFPPSWLPPVPVLQKGLPGLNLLENLKTEKPIKRKGILGETFAHDIADVENPEDSPLPLDH